MKKEAEGQIFEEHQRLVKATALADLLSELLVSAQQARQLSQEQWGYTARLAGVQVPHSSTTKEQVYQLLKRREAMRQLIQAGGHPVAGIKKDG